MSLNLSPEDEAEYARRAAINRAAKDLAVQQGDHNAARRARQANTDLYYEFAQKQPPRLAALTVEERIERIERHLGLGDYSA